MDNMIVPNDKDFDTLKSQIDEAKRQAEFQSLKDELATIAKASQMAAAEYEGVMQAPDGLKVLKATKKNPSFFDLLFDRLRGMFSLKPIIGNIIALIISGIVLYCILHEINIEGFEKYQHYFINSVLLFSALQVIKSGTRGLLLPVLTLILGICISHSASGHHMIFNLNYHVYQYMTVVGIIGLLVSVVSID